jgi:hypothetical protein
MSRGHALGLLFHLRSCAHALQMQPEKPRFSLRLIRKNHEPATTDDLDASKLSELGTRLLDLRHADHSEPTPGRPEWSLRQQLLCDVRGHRRYISGHGFPCRRLFPSEVCVPPVRKLTGAVQEAFIALADLRCRYCDPVSDTLLIQKKILVLFLQV